MEEEGWRERNFTFFFPQCGSETVVEGVVKHGGGHGHGEGGAEAAIQAW